MSARPLVPSFAADAVTVGVGEWMERQVELLLDAGRRGDALVGQLLHGVGIDDRDLTGELARLAIARDHGYEDWASARAHAADRVDLGFEAAADAIQWGELDALRALLDARPELIAMRSPFAHRATLLHHVAANGIEVERQLQSPPVAAAIARLLLERGAEPDASCELYGGGAGATTLCLIVSSAPPAAAAVQAPLVEELCRGGARPDGVEDDCLPLWTAVVFCYSPAAEALVRCGARVEGPILAAALGLGEAAVRQLDAGTPVRAPGSWSPRHRLDPARTLEYAVIWAAAHDRRDVVARLLERGPDLAVTEPFFGATALGVARHLGNAEMAALLERAAARGHG